MPSILIVEDDPMISEIYQRKFSDVGFRVFSVETGEQALAVAKKEELDVVLCDLIMPRMDGFEVIEALRKSDRNQNTKIIISSNINEKEDRDKALALGADGFIVKSEFTPSELVDEINKFLNKSESVAKNQEKSKRILLIEDEEVFIEIFGKRLQDAGYEVVSASNGAWGIKEAMEGKFDLIILDMVMPAMSGKEVVEKLKAEDGTRNIPIVVFSASVDQESQKEVEGMGIEAFFLKTQLTPSTLVGKIDEILR
jgi:hypothetical protein